MFVFMFILLITCVSASVERTESSEKSCNNGICNAVVYSGARYTQDKSSNWVDPSEVFSISKSGDDLTFNYNGSKGNFSITFEVGAIYDGSYFSMAQIKTLKPAIIYKFPIQKQITSWKYAINVSNVSVAVQEKLGNITLTYKSHEGFDISQLTKNNKKYKIKNIATLVFDDLTENNFTIDIMPNEKRIYIGNLTDKFIDGELYLDPSIILQHPGNLTADSYVEHANPDTNYGTDVDLWTENHADSAFRQTTYLKFNLSLVPDNLTISNATVNMYATLVEGSWVDKIYEVNLSEPTADWQETAITWNNQPCGADSGNEEEFDPALAHRCNSTSESEIFTVVDSWNEWIVWNMVKKAYANGLDNVSMAIRPPIASNAQQHTFHSTEYSVDPTLRPFLNVSYTDTSNPGLNFSFNISENSIEANSTINVTVNVSDNFELSFCQISSNQTNAEGIFNFSVSGTKDKCSQNFTIYSNITAVINFTVRVNDSFNIVNQTSIVIEVVDVTAPSIFGNRTSSSSVTLGQTVDLFVNFSDLIGVNVVKVEIEDPNTDKTNITMVLNNGYPQKGEWKDTFTTSILGEHSLVFYAIDTSGNEVNNGNELNFTVVAAETPSSGGGGGGGGDAAICGLELFLPKAGRLISMFAPVGQFTKDVPFIIKNTGDTSGTYQFSINGNSYLEDNCVFAEDGAIIEADLTFENTIKCKVDEEQQEAAITVMGCGSQGNYKLVVGSSAILHIFSSLFSGEPVNLFGMELSPFILWNFIVLIIFFVVVPIIFGIIWLVKNAFG